MDVQDKKVRFGEVTVIKSINKNAEIIANTSNGYKMFCKTTISYGNLRVKTSSLVDSGTKSSLMGQSTFLRLGKKAKLEPPSGDENLVSADGEPIDILGYIVCEVKLGSVKKYIRFKVVKKLISSVILGADDLGKFKAVLDFEKKSLVIDGEVVKLSQQFDSINMVAISGHTLQPGEVKHVRIRPCERAAPCSYVFDPVDIKGVDTVCSVIDLNMNRNACALIHNTSEKAVKIDKGQTLGAVSPIPLCEDIIYLDKEEVRSLDEQLSSLKESSSEPVCATIKKDSQTYVKKKLKRKNKKKRMSKPTHSRPLGTNDINEEEIIRDKLKMKKDIMTQEQIDRAYRITIENRSAFSLSSGDIGCSRSFEYNLELKNNAELMFQPAYKLSNHESELLEKECEKWKALGIIDEASETVDLRFLSPALLTSKADGSARLITDMRLLGAALKRDNFNLPNVNDCLRKIGAAYELGKPLFFARFDARDSFFQLPISQESQRLTGFSIGRGKCFYYKRLPQGFHVSSAALARLQYSLYKDLEWVLCYADDTLVYASSIESLLDRVEEVLKRSGADNIKFSIEKTLICTDDVEFLGHRIANGCVQPLPKHLAAVESFQAPKDRDALRRLCGTVNFLSRYIPNYTTRIQPLFQLLKKDVEYKWTSKEESCLQDIKQHLKHHSILKLPNGSPNNYFELFTDGSAQGVGGLCMETYVREDGSLKRFIIGYASRPMSVADAKQSPTNLELMSLDVVLDHFRQTILNGKDIIVHTDHAALEPFLRGKKQITSGKIHRCIERINSYPIKLYHIAGSKNEFADFLSRDAAMHLKELRDGIPLVKGKQETGAAIGDEEATGPRRSARTKKQTQFLNYQKTGGDNRTDITERMDEEASERQKRLKVDLPMTETPSDDALGINQPQLMPVPYTAEPRNGQEPQIINSGPNLNELRAKARDNTAPELEPIAAKKDMVLIPEDNITPEVWRKLKKLEGPLFPDLDRNPIRFHGSVPENTREKIRKFLQKNYEECVLDEKVLAAEQRTDPYFADIIKYLTERVLPSRKQHARRVLGQEDSYLMVKDLLWKLPGQSIEDSGPREFRLQLCIPSKLAEQVVAHVHDSIEEAGHASFLRTLLKTKYKYYIHNISEVVRNAVESCGVCNRIKKSAQGEFSSRDPLRIVAAKSTRPMQKLQMDFFTPISTCNTHNLDRVLLVVDEYTGFTWLFATKGEGAEVCCRALKDIFTKYGVCEEISSDRGSAFISNLNKLLCATLKINKRLASSLSPRSSGLAERKNQLAKMQMRLTTLGTNKCFDSTLQEIAFAINNGISTRTNFSAFEALHGFTPNTLMDMELGNVSGIESHPSVVQDVREEHARRNHLMRESRRLSAEKMKHSHDMGISDLPEVRRGQLCLLETPRHELSSVNSKKGRVLNAGPFVVADVFGDTVLLQDLDGTIKGDLVSRRRIKVIPGYRENFPCDASLRVPKKAEVTAHLLVSGRRRQRGDSWQMLVYPYGNRQAGTWVPEDVIDN